MKTFMLGVVIGLLLAGLAPVQAQQRATVQVEVKEGEWLHYFDCYPKTYDVEGDYMAVFIAFPEGLAVYLCTFDYGTEILPIYRDSGITMVRVAPAESD